MQSRRYIRQLTAYATLLFLLQLLFVWLVPGRFVSDVFFWFVPFFYLLSLLSWMFLSRKIKSKPPGFSSAFLSVTLIRFMLYAGLLLFYSFSFPDDAIPFIITFFIFYFFFTMHEVFSVYNLLRRK